MKFWGLGKPNLPLISEHYIFLGLEMWSSTFYIGKCKICLFCPGLPYLSFMNCSLCIFDEKKLFLRYRYLQKNLAEIWSEIVCNSKTSGTSNTMTKGNILSLSRQSHSITSNIILDCSAGGVIWKRRACLELLTKLLNKIITQVILRYVSTSESILIRLHNLLPVQHLSEMVLFKYYPFWWDGNRIFWGCSY